MLYILGFHLSYFSFQDFQIKETRCWHTWCSEESTGQTSWPYTCHDDNKPERTV